MQKKFTLEDIFDSDSIPENELPWLDRSNPDIAKVEDPALRSAAADWHRQGFAHLAADSLGSEWIRLCDEYSQVRGEKHVEFTHPLFYRNCPELFNLLTHGKLAEHLQTIVGEPCGVHLTLCGWKSTQRDWHQDRYLSGEFLRDHYVAVWIALEDILPESGPFKAISGSHRWNKISLEKTRQLMLSAGVSEEEAYGPNWPRHSEVVLSEAVEGWLKDHNQKEYRFLGKKGDVLLWHPRLMHGGAVPTNPEVLRRCVIAHYSGIEHRFDMPRATMAAGGGWSFPLG